MDTMRGFGQQVLVDAQADAPMDHDLDGALDEEPDSNQVTTDTVELLEHRVEKEPEEISEASDDIFPDFGEDNAVVGEPEEGAMADREDEGEPAPGDDEATTEPPAQTIPIPPPKMAPRSPAKSPARPSARSSAKSPAKPAGKPTAEPVAKPTAKRAGRKPGGPLRIEKPTRISDRVSKPRQRAAAQRATQPKPVTKRAASKKKTASKTAADRKASGQEWEVECIVDSMIDADTHQHFYEVKWKGFSSKDNTWEPKINLAKAQAAIRAFEGGKGKRGRRPT